MSFQRKLGAGITRLLMRRRFERDLDDEVRHYVEMTAREHEQRGLSPDEAWRRARAEVGGYESVKERVRGAGWGAAVENVSRDIRYALRTLIQSPAYTVVAALTLALGVGANTTVFSLINAILLRPPPHVRAPEQLVSIYTSDFSGPAYGSSSYPDYEDIRGLGDVFADVSIYAPRPAGVGEDENLERTGVEMVSAEYFRTLGVTPALGRGFLPEEGRSGAPTAVVVISHDLWMRRFAGDSSIIGGVVRVSARNFTVVGVAPPGFSGSLRGIVNDLWIPATASPLLGSGSTETAERGSRGYFMVARLAPGVTIEQAQSRMNVLARQLTQQYPDLWTDVSGQGRRLTVLPERETRVPPQGRGIVLGFTALLGGTVALVLLVCCANVATLALGRAARRAKEIGVRLSLGATRGRIIRQLLAESLLIGLAGGALGVALAVWATRGIMAFQPPTPVRISLDLSLDARVLAFSLAVAIAAGVIFGLFPALKASRASVVGILKGSDKAIAIGRRRVSVQSILVVSQIAMSVVLVIGALLFLRSLRVAATLDPGYATDHLLLADVDPPPGTEDQIDRGAISEQLRERVRALPGVTAASWSDMVLLGMVGSRRGITIDGYRPRQGEDMEYHYALVGPEFFETLRMPFAYGRGFAPTDRQGSAGVIVVNETFARRFWPGEQALGKRISVQGPEGPYLEVVGVTRDAKYLTLTESSRPFMFFTALQQRGGTTLHVRTLGEPKAMLSAVKQVVNEVAPGWTVENVRTMEEQAGTTLLPQRVAGTVLSLFGAAALLLAAVGLYGVVAVSVAARTHEFGVRIALGARPSGVRRMVLRQGTVLVAIGLAIGVPLAWAASRLLSGFLIGTEAGDLVSFGGAALLLVAVALLASWFPARRATGVSPLVALRAE